MPRIGRPRDFYKHIREAIEDGMTVDQVIEVFNFDVGTLLDTLGNEDLLDHVGELEDYIPRAFEEWSEYEDGEDTE